MNKTVYPFVIGMLIISVHAGAMESGSATVAKEIGSTSTSIVAPVTPAQPTCRLCPIKRSFQNVLGFCKRHPVLIAVGAIAAAVVITYSTVPSVKEQINTLLGFKTIKQADNADIDTHSLPIEKIEEPKAA